MRNSFQRCPLLAYSVLACTISWALWLPLVMRSRGADIALLPYQHYIGSVGPMLAAMVVVGTINGKNGVAQLLRGLLKWRVELRWYVIAILGPAALYAVSAAGIGLYGGEWPAFSQFGRSGEFPGLGPVGVSLLQFLTFGVGEEIGWRGFALPRLQAKHNALAATLLLTVAWAAWHIPAFFYRPGYSAMDAADILGWFFSLLTGALLLTWLYNSAEGSILIVALFHGSIDVAFTSKPIDTSVMNTMGALIVAWAIIVIIITGPTNLSQRARQQTVLTEQAGPS